MWTTPNSKYEPVESEESNLEVTENIRWANVRASPSWGVVLGASVLIAFILTSAIFGFLRQSNPATKPLRKPWHPCGRTPAEAKAANCSFDVMMDEWLPESCIDRELLEEFKALKDWPFWADAGRTQPINETQLSESAVAFTTLEYHVAHCSFAVRKFHRALAAGRPIEEAVARVSHTTHCTEMHRKVIENLENSRNGEEKEFSIHKFQTPLHPGFPICIDTKDYNVFQ